MNFEVVNMKGKTVVGFAARTNNFAPDMQMVIGGLWEKLYSDNNYDSIYEKCNDKAMGIYTDYDGDEKQDYTVLAACEVKEAADLPKGMEARTLPAGKFAKFIVKGHMQKAVAAFWQELWQMDLARSFQYDFEEYQNGDMEHAEVHIYIGLLDND